MVKYLAILMFVLASCCDRGPEKSSMLGKKVRHKTAPEGQIMIVVREYGQWIDCSWMKPNGESELEEFYVYEIEVVN